MKIRFKSLVSAAVGLFCAVNFAHANLLVNGSFENGDFSGNTIGAWKTLGNGNNSLTGWTIGGDGVDWHNSVQFQTIVDGDKVVDLNAAGAIAQSFATTAGNSYDVNFFVAAPGSFFGSRNMKVNVAGVDHNFLLDVTSDNMSLIWQQISFSFQATNALTTIQFSNRNQNGGYWGALIDNVNVDASIVDSSNVPEPSSLFLLGLGFLGLSSTRFGKRR